MKITQRPVLLPVPETTGNRPASPAAPVGSATENAVRNPSLSHVASQLRASGEVDMDKVDAIRLAIAEGRLPMDLDRLAEAVLELHRR